MERVIALDTSEYLKDCGLISKEQHGFIKSRSTCTNLLDSLNDWTLHFSTHTATDVAYIDFAKAFDKVCHNKLLHKLEAYGIGGDLLLFLRNYLSHRKQCTKVGNCLSNFLDIKSGVIQGSCIGPLMFVIFINDITDCLSDQSTVKLYADDIKLYSCIETSADINRLQLDLNNIFAWSELWQMEVSISKCFILPIGGKLLCLHDRHYAFNNSELPTVFNIRDLGVIMDRDLSFTDHVDNIVSRASVRANLIIRCFVSGDTQLLTKAFTVYVRPILEFNSSIWSPRHVKDIQRLESVQRQFTKRLSGLRDRDYNYRLRALNLESLELRRLKADLILTYKILFGLIDLDPNNFFSLQPEHNINTRGHAFRLSVPDSNSDVRRHYFSTRIVTVWNKLPEQSTDFSSLNRFKNSITNSYLLQYCKLDFNS
jgi:ribonucleases P/MRP protein subunit RPP40